jgi:Flp pilus assembly protein TadG
MRIKNATLGKCFRRMIKVPVRRFRRDESGATAIEFSIVLLPFLALLFAIIETAMIFLSGQLMETAVADSARLILTGQAQAATGGLDQTNFKKAVCDKIKGLVNCSSGVYVDVRKFTSFSTISFDPPVDADGNLVKDFTYQPGGAGDIVVVRLLYEFPVYTQLWNPSLVTMSGNKRLIIATAAFRNEPF